MRELFKLYFPRLSYFAQSLTDDMQESEDIAISALSKVWELFNRDPSYRIDNIHAWLFATVKNSCLNYIKHQKVKNGHHRLKGYYTEFSEEIIEARLIEEDLIHKIYLEIQSLPPRCRKVAELSYIRGLNPEEISEQLHITPSTVRSQQARALELIRVSLIKRKILPEMMVLNIFLNLLDKMAG